MEELQQQLAQLNSLDALRRLVADWGYEAVFEKALLPQAAKADERAQECLADDPQIVAEAGEFKIIYAPLIDFEKRAIGAERLVISRLINDFPFALWIFSNKAKTRWHFVNVKRGAGKGTAAMSRHILRRYSFTQDDLPGRTSVQQLQKIDLAELAVLPGIPPASLEVQSRHDAAFDVEAVTRDFFRDYRAVFERVESQVNIDDANACRLWTQRLFNRLMFLRFLEKKGWLEFDGNKNYLRRLFKAANQEHENFLNDRLYYTFFFGLNMPINERKFHKDEMLRTRRGLVPFLNGGLFEQLDVYDVQGKINLDNAAFELILDLFDKYNFTIHESTPFDQEIGIDPEMLGKVFEELVVGRHESGSYYTPRGVVSFMARESLKGYLEKVETSETVEKFVDHGDASALSNPEKVLLALRTIKVCDPACGSGAYLLGMMQELLHLREALFVAKARDHASIFQRKLEIIENNLYGVDLDPFAVNIAMLRLWLSLIIEYEGDTPPPLPNLKYKIGEGNSLSAPLAGAAQLVMHESALREFVQVKNKYLHSHSEEKKTLDEQVEKLRADIRLWTHSGENIRGFDWVVEFAEVFMPQEESTTVFGTLNLGQQLPSNTADGGFDIVIANPPYVRQELIKDQKPQLRKIFQENFSGTADLYVFFYLRAHQLLAPGGMLAFISPNKWFRAAYGAKLRKYFSAHSSVRSITDFGELPVFQTAATFPMIFIAQKSDKARETPTMFAQIKSLDAPYPDVRALMDESAVALPDGALNGEDWNLANAATSKRLTKMHKAGISLDEYVKGQVYYGVKTGLNKAFVIDSKTRARLIAADKNSKEIIKVMSKGDDVRRWRIEEKDRWLIFTRRGINIEKYPAIKKYLSQWKAELTPKTPGAIIGRKPGRYKWFEIQDDVAYYKEFDKPKIIYPQIMMEPRFTFDAKGIFTNQKCYIISTCDFYLLGILNSTTVWDYLVSKSVPIGDPNERGRIEPRKVDILSIPIPKPSASDRSTIESLVETCLQKRGADCEAEETEINARVAKLYGL